MVNDKQIIDDAAVQAELEREITQLLYASSNKSLAIAFVVAAMIAYIQSGIIAKSAIITWIIPLLIAYLTRHAFAMMRRRNTLKSLSGHQWLQIFRVCTTLCGAAWGLASLFLFPSADIARQAFLASCLAGVCGGAIIVYSVDKLTSFGFSCGLLLITLPSFFIYGDDISQIMAFMLLLFVIYTSAAGLTNAKVIRESITLKIKAIFTQKSIDALSQRQKLHIENTPLGVIEWTTDFKVNSWNAAAERIFGYSLMEIIDKHGSFLLPEAARLLYTPNIENLLPGGSGHHVETENMCKDGSLIHCEWFNTPIKDTNDNIVGIASLVQDKTAVKQAQDEIQRLAYFDVLTNLPNRRLLNDRLNQALANSERNKTYGSVMYIDLDNFKALNDSKGHAMGDLLLQEVANRLQTLIRNTDTVARIGGDEFALIFGNIGTNEEQANAYSQQIAEKIITEINLPYTLNGHLHHCSPSIGICMFNGKTIIGQDILKRADIAMYQAKQAGRNSYRQFDEDMQPILNLRASLKNDLGQALLRSELKLYYQIQVDKDLTISGAEALLRWNHPQHGMVSPGEFIPLAEESGLIIPIGTWVLEQACMQLAKWEKSAETKKLHLSVNVSALQFSQSDFVQKVAHAITENGCNSKLLTLELTESAILHNIDDVVNKMHALKKLGVSLSMDDFGVGYSSFSVLKRLPLDELKIDQSFIQDSLEGHANATIVKSIIDMGKNIGLNVIAEGVETNDQVNFLQNSECKAFQGYLFGKPADIDTFERSLKTFASSQSAHTGSQPAGSSGTQPISI